MILCDFYMEPQPQIEQSDLQQLADDLEKLRSVPVELDDEP